MPVVNTIHTEQGVIVMQLTGKVTYNDFAKALADLWQDERALGTTCRIMDLRECMLALKVSEASLVSRMELLEAKRFGITRVAILLPPMADKSMVKILEREELSAGIDVRFFDELDDVIAFAQDKDRD